MKIIFLDIDGVLNHELWYRSERQCDRVKDMKAQDKDHRLSMIDPAKIELLNSLIKDTGAKVVISSTWRKGTPLDELENLFEQRGFEGEIIDVTPYLRFTGLEDYSYSVPRGCEIKAWLETNKGILNAKISRVKYVIFDDDSDMLYWQRNNFIWVDPYCGLTPNLTYKARHILTQQ